IAFRSGRALRQDIFNVRSTSPGPPPPSSPPPRAPRPPRPRPPPAPLSTSVFEFCGPRCPAPPIVPGGALTVTSLAQGELVMTFLTSSSVHCVYSFLIQKSSPSAIPATSSPARPKKAVRCITCSYMQNEPRIMSRETRCQPRYLPLALLPSPWCYG